MSRIDNIMEESDVVEESSTSTHSNADDRRKSIMDEDYETEDNSAEPEDKKLESEHKPSSEQKKEKKEKKEDDKEEKEDEKEKKEDKKEKKEEEKKEPEKKKIKYKVDGQEIEEEVTEQDLINSYSGQKAIQKRFSEIDKEKKSIAKDREEFKKEYEFVKKELSDLRESFSSTINEFTKTGQLKNNPVESIYTMLDKMGLDVKEYDKALFSHFLPEVANFLGLDETGREAFLLKKENEWLKKGRDKLSAREQEMNERRSKLEEENSLKRQNGISEEQFSELRDELESRFNLPNLSTEEVIQWNKERPFYFRAEKIAEKVPNVDVIKLAKILYEFPETTDEWMLEELGYKKILETKVAEEFKGKVTSKPSIKKVDYDEDDELFNNFRRR